MKLCVLVTGAAFAPERQPGINRLMDELGPQCDALGVRLVLHMNHDASSHMTGAYEALAEAMRDPEVTHVCGLPDDSILVPHFVEVLLSCIKARPDDVIDLASNHLEARDAYAAGNRWYSTVDAALLGTTAPVAVWREYLDWRKASFVDDESVPFDDGFTLWLAHVGRLIYKPLPSLCQHDLTLPSLTGNQYQTVDLTQRILRESQVWEPQADLRAVDWSDPPVNLHRMFQRRHWEGAWRVKPDALDPEALYRLERNGSPVRPKRVFIATPAYGGPELAYLRSVAHVADDLQRHGYSVHHEMTGGDSLVTRGRHVLCHMFLCSDAEYFLQWDADVEIDDPAAVRMMIESGHDIVGGAYPFRDGSGQVVANALAETRESKHLEVVDGFARVAEVGTGFLLLRRGALVDLQKRHPNLLYEADLTEYAGRPMWALFDAALEVNRVSGRKRYASEDWRFCSLARAAGYDVWCYVPPVFRHWGKHGHTGHISRAWGFGESIDSKAAAE